MARKRWSELSPHAQRLIIAGASIEGVAKLAALIDLARRPSTQIKGPKMGWAAAITTINAAGAVPILYLTRGIRRSHR